MAVSHTLEDVNNFMQIFEPALCELAHEHKFLTRDQCSQKIFIHRMAILVEFSPCLFRPFMAFVRYF